MPVLRGRCRYRGQLRAVALYCSVGSNEEVGQGARLAAPALAVCDKRLQGLNCMEANRYLGIDNRINAQRMGAALPDEHLL